LRRWIASLRSHGDVDAATQRIRELGRTINQGPIEVPGDQRAVMASDPEGVPFMLVGK
jgi:predicted enzyme related to lactoylglutathione lyase